MRNRLVGILLSLPLLTSIAHARHPVFSLVDNRPLAHAQRRGGLYIEAGAPGMAKYVHFSRPTPSWKLRVVEEQKRVALPQAVATIEVPLTKAQADGKVIYIFLKAPASSVKATVDGKLTSKLVMLKAGWQLATIPMPDGALHAGENSIRFNFANYGTYAGQKAAAAVEAIQIGGDAPTAADARAPGDRLALADNTGYAWFGYVPTGGALSVKASGSCKLHARVAPGEGAAVEGDLALDGTPLDLGSLAGKFARIDLAASGGACNVNQADILTEGDAPTRIKAPPPKNVIFWLTDDTRADKYKFYNPHSRVATPVFDELMKRSSTFRVAYTQGNESKSSHASIWTSTWPGVHKCFTEKAKLDPSFVTMAEAIKPSGRYVAGVMGNGYIDKFWGFADGWDFLRNNIHDLPSHGLSADALLADGKIVMNAQKGKPFFLYIGTIDSHVSWRAHEPWLSRYDTTPGAFNPEFTKACTDPTEEKIVLGKLHITERDKARITALYDSDISYNDAVLGKLIDDLKARGILDETMIVMTSDHGEELWDHGKLGHGGTIREELVHVPFIISYPPLFPAKVVEEGIDVMDALPTILDALGVPIPDSMQGESVLPLAEGIGAGYPRPAIASQYELAHTMRLGKYKLWVGGSGDVHLWDAANDAKEDKDLVNSRPVEKRALTDAMGLWMANRNQWKKRKWGVASNLSPGFAADNEK